jgi:hypothetical protein
MDWIAVVALIGGFAYAVEKVAQAVYELCNKITGGGKNGNSVSGKNP